VSETWLNLGSQVGGARLIVKSVGGRQAIGHAQLHFNLEVVAKDDATRGCPLLFHGRLELLAQGDAPWPLVSLAVLDRSPILRGHGNEVPFTLTADIDDRQLQLIEDNRAGDLRLRLSLPGLIFREGQFEVFLANSLDHTIPQSEWIKILEQVGYTKTFLVEVDTGSLQLQPPLVEAYGYYLEARTRYMEGQWRHAVESLRQCLAALVGKKPEDEDSAADIANALKTTKASAYTTDVGYSARFELVRQSAKFLCDLAAHPGSEETCRKHARAALVLVTGLMESYRR
jgi:hypothetical protein